jgi:hypothetical protein
MTISQDLLTRLRHRPMTALCHLMQRPGGCLDQVTTLRAHYYWLDFSWITVSQNENFNCHLLDTAIKLLCTSSYLVHMFTRTHTSAWLRHVLTWSVMFLLHLSIYRSLGSHSGVYEEHAVFWDVPPCILVRAQWQVLLGAWFMLFTRLAYSATPNIEAVYFSETSDTRRYIL